MSLNNNWTDKRLEILREIYPQGSNSWVARQINEQTGSAFTRNAIIGKASREGIIAPKGKHREPKSVTERQANREKKLARDRERWRARQGFRLKIAPLPEPISFDDDVVFGPKKTIHELSANIQGGDCRWIEGDPREEACYCGAQSVQDKPYCGFHMRLNRQRAA